MSLSSGSLLGPYEILEPVGSGGMADVYKARDTRLDRTVAIKVSREEFSERFQSEARAVAAVNHPHICTLFDIGPNYLVMEYVEGKPLAGPLPLAEALHYAVQIADALDHAHRNGVIHRDLKPTNILVNKGKVTLLDFGLAKRRQAGDETLTQKGTALGTPAYMAPEQWQGKEADARSDIFAFGCVLYELVTGKQAATGVEPVQPPALDWTIRRCLARDPDDRWQTARDLRAALERVQDVKETFPATLFPRMRPWLAAVILLVLLAAVAVDSWRRGRPTPATGMMRLEITAPERTTLADTVAISPDGSRLAFAAIGADGVQRLWVRALDSVAARTLPGTEDARLPFWSPDGRSLGFFAGGRLKRVDTTGGTPQILCDAPFGAGGTWNRDGIILFAPNVSGILHRVSSAGGLATPVTSLDENRSEIAHRFPQFLDAGPEFLFYAASTVPRNSGIFQASLEQKDRKLVLATEGSSFSASAAHLLFVQNQSLLAQPWDEKRARLKGEPFKVVERVETARTWIRQFSVSDAGVLAYPSGVPRKRQLAWFDRTGRPVGTVGQPDLYQNPSLSPDGRKIAVGRPDPQSGEYDIWLLEPARDMSTRITFHPLREGHAIWSPDGQRVAFISYRDGIANVFWKYSSGAGNEEPLLPADRLPKVARDWSRDGGLIVYEAISQADRDLWILPVGANSKPFPFLRTEFLEMEAQFSPESETRPRYIAYVSNESGTFEVYVQNLSEGSQSSSAGTGKWKISNGGGRQPRWRGDGRELFYLAPDARLMSVQIERGGGFSAGAPRPLFSTRVYDDPFPGFQYAADSDGQRFLINTPALDDTPAPITVVLNWPAAGRR